MFKIIKRIALVLALIVVVISIGVTLFVSLAPQFGAKPEGEDLIRIKQSENFQNEEFINIIETSMELDLSKLPDLMQSLLFPPKGKNPAKLLPTKWEEGNSTYIDSLAYITWYGHSAVKLEIDGKTILLDPMLGSASAPVSFMTQRFGYQEPIDFSAIGDIDAIIISHDHYDHLDHESILKLKDKTKHFYTALGVGSHLKHWGVPAEKITELDWWQSADFEGVKFTAAPSRHFSGRAITDRNKTQWASWIVKGQTQNIYFSGDGGSGPHFEQIGEKFGPFDLAMMENGQYNEQWAQIHMMPEQSIQAGIDVKGKVLMPIHWGAFDLAPHLWQDPIVRFTAKAQELNQSFVTPVIGERFAVGVDTPVHKWWD